MAISAKIPTDVTEACRLAVVMMVNFEERHVGREAAYYNVAKEIDRSFSWVKKAVLGDIQVKGSITLLLKIKSAYDTMCSCVEQEHEREVARLASLQGEIDAVAEGFMELAHSQIESRNRRTTTRTFEARAA